MSIKLRPRWDQRYNYEESIKILTDFAWSHIHESGRFRGALANCLRTRDWSALCDLEIDYRYDDSPLHLYHARQALAFFQKLEPLRLAGVDKEAVAWRKFQDAERTCGDTNRRFRMLARGEICFPPRVNSVLHGAQRKIARILGNVPKLESLQLRFGPGANTSVKASKSTARHKLGARLECSASCINAASVVLSECPGWAANHAHAENSSSWFVDVDVVHGRLQFVPKNAKTYRSIVVEPLINSIAQKGFGSYLKKRLASAMVDLSDQTRNQKLARSGSISNSLATIDLSSASDTISKEVVASLLPLDWFSTLAQFRTETVDYRGNVIHLEKFSSMGNAYTFELESLIFYAISFSVCEFLGLPTGWTSIFGDDIIIPSEGYNLLSEVLSYCGFSVNDAKTFWDGPFRESCGKDYWRGIDIRPFYQKDLVSGQSLFLLHNFYQRNFDKKRAEMVLKRIHPDLRLFGPDGYGDGHLLGDWQRKRSKKDLERGWGGVRFDTFTLKPKRAKRMVPGDWVYPSYSIYVADTSELRDPLDQVDHMVVRGSQGYKRTSIYTLCL